MSDGTLFTGKTVEEAVADGLRSLGLTEQQVEIVVINRGSRGLFGLGSEPAQVRIVPRTQNASAPVAAGPAISVEVPAPPKNEPGLVVEEVKPPAAEPVAEPAPQKIAAGQAVPTAEPQDAEPGAADLAVDVEDAELIDLAVDLLSETVRLMGFDATVTAGWRAPDARRAANCR